MFKNTLFVLSWFVAGGLAFYATMLNGKIGDLSDELSSQQEGYEARIQQLQTNLKGAQTQMTNLSAALQEARELLEPATRQAIEQTVGDSVL